MQSPRVSVIIPTYNRSQALRATVESVLAQTFADWELIIVDDGSTDDTLEVARSFTDQRVTVCTQANARHSAARNNGLGRARGELVAFLDHDDRWVPHKLERQVDYLDAHPDCVLVYGRWEGIDEEGRPQGPGKDFSFAGNVTRELLTVHNFVHSMSMPLMRTAQVRQVGGFRAEMDICDDLDLFLRLSRLGPFGFIPEVLLQYNVGIPGQQSRDMSRGCMSLYRCITRGLAEEPSLTPSERASIRRDLAATVSHELRSLAWWALRERDYPRAWAHYVRAVRMRPALLRDTRMLRDVAVLARNTVIAPRASGSGG